MIFILFFLGISNLRENGLIKKGLPQIDELFFHADLKKDLSRCTLILYLLNQIKFFCIC
jgi:hypothetical protein